MAQITKRKDSYTIRVSCGYSADGKKQITQSMTWRPPKPNMTPKQLEKALQAAAYEFEKQCQSGQIVAAVKFETFCETWFEQYAARTLKLSGIERCRAYTPRVYEKLGHLRLDKITPREIDGFISWLTNQNAINRPTATYNGDFESLLKDKGYTRKGFAKKAGVTYHVIKSIIDGNKVIWANAEKVAAALGTPCSKLFENAVTDQKLTPKTIKNYVSFVSSVFDYAVHTRVIKENPCKNALLPKVPEKEHTMFTIEQAKQFLNILDGENIPLKYKAFFQLAIFGGFRRGEILGLEWGDIDFNTDIVHIVRTAHYSTTAGYYDTTPKSKHSVRSLKLPPNVIFTLRQLQNEQNSQRLKIGNRWHETSRLFTAWDGKPMHGATPFVWLEKLCKAHGLPKVNLHSFRHLNASLLISQGVDVKTVQSVLGHSQASTTLDIYAAAFREREAQALGAVAAVLNEPISKKA